MSIYVRPIEAMQHFNISRRTLQRWVKSNKVDFISTKGGHKRILIDDGTPSAEKFSFIYARVSSRKQLHNMDHQISFLETKYPQHTLIKDIGSGVNLNRREFRFILEQLFRGNVQEVIVANKDRFVRFNFEFYQFDPKYVFLMLTTSTLKRHILVELMKKINAFIVRFT